MEGEWRAAQFWVPRLGYNNPMQCHGLWKEWLESFLEEKDSWLNVNQHCAQVAMRILAVRFAFQYRVDNWSLGEGRDYPCHSLCIISLWSKSKVRD